MLLSLRLGGLAPWRENLSNMPVLCHQTCWCLLWEIDHDFNLGLVVSFVSSNRFVCNQIDIGNT